MAAEPQEIFNVAVLPLLQAAVDAAGRHGMPLVAACEYEPGRTAMRFTGPLDQSKAGAAILLVDCAARAQGDADQMMRALMLHASAVGHSSELLLQLGVPQVPAGSLAVEGSDGPSWLRGQLAEVAARDEVLAAVDELAVELGDPIILADHPRTRESEVIRQAASELRARAAQGNPEAERSGTALEALMQAQAVLAAHAGVDRGVVAALDAISGAMGRLGSGGG